MSQSSLAPGKDIPPRSFGQYKTLHTRAYPLFIAKQLISRLAFQRFTNVLVAACSTNSIYFE